MIDENERPDPDELLKKVLQERQSVRGKLKIFFGACAGVGKTYAMLVAAKAKIADGVDVAVGLVETHGRAETARLLDGLEVIAPASLEYHGKFFDEMNLDAALQRKPGILLVDELAHTNIPGSRHHKRWQDVEELLHLGIDVYTTLNVQHLESLNDIVGQITGIRVRETLPDRIFDAADEISLVDLPPDELLRRLREGKVYIPRQAARAVDGFFRKGNLIALRELSLRRAADRIDAQMRDYRADMSISQVWQARERILVCIGPNPDSERLVRAAARLAAAMHADWLAVFVDTPELLELAAPLKERIHATLRMAQELGAETASIPGSNLAISLAAFARENDITTLVLGQTELSGWRKFFRVDLAKEVSRYAPEVGLHVVAQTVAPQPVQQPQARRVKTRGVDYLGYLLAMLVCVVATGVGQVLLRHLDLANFILLYLVGVVAVSARLGQGPGLFAAMLSVGLFDFFFVNPRFSFTVDDTRHLLTFSIMLAVAMLVGKMTARLRFQAIASARREHRAEALHLVGKELAASLTVDKTLEISLRHLRGLHADVRATILLPDSKEQLRQPIVHFEPGTEPPSTDLGIAQWSFTNRAPAGLGTATLSHSALLYIPLPGTMKVRGVLALLPANPEWLQEPEQMRLLESFANQVGQTLERIHYIEVAQDSLLRIEAERLRNSLLSTVSHDIRTPLSAMIGQAGNLATLAVRFGPEASGMAQSIHEDALRLGYIVDNILDMARLQSGRVHLHKQWHMLEEIVGVALASSLAGGSKREFILEFPADLPLVEIDAALLERVFANLIGNALKYAPDHSSVRLSARAQPSEIVVSVEDSGPGIPAGHLEQIFDKFRRGDEESCVPGVGLGLAICKAIVEVHGGRIWAENIAPHGARFVFTLPLGASPSLDDEVANEHDR
jgi:two-component system, OmpR family, sensor histidine kinase KdpD